VSTSSSTSSSASSLATDAAVAAADGGESSSKLEALLSSYGLSMTNEARLSEKLKNDATSQKAFVSLLSSTLSGDPAGILSSTSSRSSGSGSSSSSSSSSSEDEEEEWSKAHPSTLCTKIRTGAAIGKEGDAGGGGKKDGHGGDDDAEWPLHAEWEWEPRTLIRRKSVTKMAFTFCPFPPTGAATDKYSEWHDGTLEKKVFDPTKEEIYA
jgi:hypothetical protein